MTSKEIKSQLLQAAASIAAAVVSKMNVSVPADPTVQDPTLRSLNVAAFEEVEVHYNALRLAFENSDPNAFPDPTVATPAPVTGSIPNPGANLAGLAQVAGTVAQVASAVAAGS